MIMIEETDVKYIKKKPSNTSKAKEKSKHKHEYVDCLFIHNDHPHLGTYCKICGKVGQFKFSETERLENGMWRQLDYDEIYEKYQDLEHVQIDDWFQKFVPVGGNNEENK